MSDSLTIRISGPLASGKSTVLVLLADTLRGLGYKVEIPKHLEGLHVNTDLLYAGKTENTEVCFIEEYCKP